MCIHEGSVGEEEIYVGLGVAVGKYSSVVGEVGEILRMLQRLECGW